MPDAQGGFDFDADDDLDPDETRERNPENQKRIEDALHAKEKEAAKFRKQAESAQEELALLKEKDRGRALGDAAKQLGLKEKHLGFYPGDAPTDAEALRTWAVDNEFISGEQMAKEDPDEGEGKVRDDSGFDPGGLGGHDGEVIGKRLTTDDAFQLYMSGPDGPAKFLKAARAGKVEGIDPNRISPTSLTTIDVDYGDEYFYEPRVDQ